MNDELKRLREKIDALDDEIIKLINERAGLAKQIGGLKNGLVYRPEREAQVLARVKASNRGPLPNEDMVRLFTEIMSLCRALEEPLSVAYLGPRGTFSEDAAQRRFGSAAVLVPCVSIDDVFRKVESRMVSYGVVPVENSTEGTVGRTLDLLLQTSLKVCGEVELPVHQCLMAKGQDLSRIQKVYSHPQSFAQCHEWLNGNLPPAVRVNVSSNAEAASLAAVEPNAAAVAGKKAAELSGLTVLAENIEDDPRNTTRFLVIGNQDVAPSGRDKTSLVMSAQNRPGAVHDLLAPFAVHGVSMTKFESRPSRTGLWEYVFYVDIEGHQQDGKVAKSLAELRERAAFLKILGSYPTATI